MSGFLIQSDGRLLADIEARLAKYLPGLDVRLLPLSASRAIVRSHVLQALATEYDAPRDAWLAVLGIADVKPLTDEQAVALLQARRTDELPPRRPPATASRVTGPDWHLDAVNVRPAWALLGGPGQIAWGATKVAHLDTGYTKHPAFGFEGVHWVDTDNARTDMPPPPNGGDHFVLPEPGGALDPLRGFNAGHGTNIGATICGFDPASPGSAYHGIAPKVPYLPMRITDAVLVDHAQRQIAAALRHVIDVGGAQVVNISLGILAPILPQLRSALNHAYDRGVIVICAAGNIVDPVVAPARLRRTVAVAGVTRKDQPWSGSSFGPEVDFSAPAADLRRADVTGQVKPKYSYRSGGDGTSYATAITSGAAALWLTHRWADLAAVYTAPWCTVAAFTKLARDTARVPLGVPWDPDGAFGRGILDIGALLSAPLPPQATLAQDKPV